MEACALLVVVQVIDVLTTVSFGAKLLARDSCQTGTSVNDQSLWLSVGANEHSHVEVHEVCGIAIQGSRCQF